MYKLGRARINTLILIGSIVFLLLSSVLAIHFYTHRGWTRFDIPIAALTTDHQGTVWAVDTKGGVWFTEGARLLPSSSGPVQMPHSAEEKVTSLAIDGQGQIWAGTSNRNVVLYKPSEGWVTFSPDSSTEKYEFSELAVDGLDRVWVSSNGELGVIDINNDNKTYKLNFSRVNGYRVSAFTIDNQGHVWVIETGEVIGNRRVKVLGSDGVWNIYGTIKAEDFYHGEDLAIDRFGQVWIGAYLKDEVSKLEPDGHWSTYPVDDDQGRYASPHLLFFDSKDQLWGISIGLFKLDTNGRLIVYKRKLSGFPDGGIKDLVLDREGRVWIYSYPDKLTAFDVEKGFPPANHQTMIFIAIAALISIPSIVLCKSWLLARIDPGIVHFRTIRDFYIGLLGWFAICTIFLFGIGLLPFGGPGAAAIAQLCVSVTLIPTIIGLAVFFRKRRGMIFGALSAFAINTIGILLIFSSLDFSSPIPYIFMMVPFFTILS